ncbi:MAG TPA: FAD-binding oxidoreductase [Steroidobacteraceae bacterium]|nr:FAD-binding oxidoreductase [Steroidobacteraceae bacterium]
MMSNAKGRRPQTALVIGGGVVGLACAMTLRLRGIDTLLLEPALVQRGASWGNAGHIAVEQVEPLASLRTIRSFPGRLFWRGGALSLPAHEIAAWLPFTARLLQASRPRRFAAGKEALKSIVGQAMPAWRRLSAEADAQALIVEDGHYIVWETAAGARAGRQSWNSTDIGAASIRDVTPQEAASLSSLMARPPAGAVRFVGTGRVRDPGDLTDRLAAAFVASGGVQRRERAQTMSIEKSHASVFLVSGERLSADAIVVAAGVGSAPLLEQIGHRAPVIAERGYHIQSDTTDWPDLPPVVFEERSMIVSRFRTGLRAASFVEFGRENTPADPRKWQRLRSHVAELGLSFTAPGSEWMGARPTLPDYLPAIGRSNRADNLLYAFGHQHLGLTLAAITGEMIGALSVGEDPALDAGPFSLDRF